MPAAHLAALLASAATALAAPPGVPATTIIRGAAIVDVERGVLIHDRDILIEDDRIVRLIARDTPLTDADRHEIEAQGLFVIPGLFDAHVHLAASMDTDPKLMIAHGVTSARDLGAPTQPIIELRNSTASGERLGPDLIVTGAIIDGDPPVWPFSEACDTPEAGRAAVRRLHEAGVDMIKVYSRLKKDVYEAVVAEAHAVGLKVTGHIPESVTLTEAIAAGQDCNEHLMRIEAAFFTLADKPEPRNRAINATLTGWAFLDDIPQDKLTTWAKSIAESGMMQCPTIIVMQGIGRTVNPESKNDPGLALVSGQTREFWASEAYTNWAQYAGAIVPGMQKTVKLFHDTDVPLMVGTDLGNPYIFAGRSVHDEMALWQDAGIPAPAILKAATLTPATFCNLADSHGSIAPGKVANLVLLRNNPLTDIRNTTSIERLILRGRDYDRAALDSIIESVRTTIADESTAQPAPDAPLAANLPGKEVARGVYRMLFGKFDAGTESFVITETDDAYHFFADIQPKGGGQTPSTVTAHASKQGEIKSVQWNQKSAPPVAATYTIDGPALTATATKGDHAQPVQTVEFTDKHLLSVPAIASGFLENRALALKPGETRELTVLSFGYPDWRTMPSPYKVTRFEDSTIERNGAQVQCAHYIAETTTPIGLFKTESWVDDNAIPYRAVITMPFGAVTFVRE